MAKKRTSARRSSAAVTARRAPRLYRLLKLLGKGPQTRAKLIRQLALDIRSFYRDLNLLRDAGIEVLLQGGHYLLQGTVTAAVARLPFPDPLLTLGEAQQLARGRSAAHRRLKKLIDQIIK
jgi:predicted DNA-binding transcriptional regulator YafY